MLNGLKKRYLVFATCLFFCACNGTKIKNTPKTIKTICCFGDSLIAGVGAGSDETKYHNQLKSLIGITDITANGKSGDTTGQALSRLNKIAEKKYDLVIVTLGGNDMLRQTDWKTTEKNIRKIFQTLIDSGSVVAYTSVVRNSQYEDICKEMGVIYIHSILKGIKFNDDLTIDKIHPNDDGYKIVAERVAKSLKDADLFDK
ncbi:MAG: arylesterase [Lentisphaeria bacterium]|nr:GDSL-type esterase/lipase family protein [Lentisphaeria bacterium]NQZ67758.1 arylesterase [Lentisphaeria bacterium]